MAEVTKAALANRTKQVIFWGCCCHLVVLASDYVQAAAVKPVHTAQHWLSERPRFRCVCQRRTHSKLVRPQLQRARQPVVCPYAGERAECSLCDGHVVTNVSVVSTVTLHSRPQILERVEVLERSVAGVHLALQSLGSTPLCCTALSASEPRRERCVTLPSHQRAAWIFNPRCVGNVREQASHLCASFRASTSASIVELTHILQWICMTLLVACEITIAA